MSKPSTFVGLDVHKASIAIALLRPGQREPLEWSIRNEPGAVHRLIRKLEREAQDGLQCCYEAGPTGYVLKRQFDRAGIPCMVIAPSLIPVKPGSAIKTDRRDARKLAELLRAGMLTEVAPPTEEEEAVRDLTRSRDDAQRDLTRARNRLSKFLLRRGCVYAVDRRPTWSQKYRAWLRSQRFDRLADQVVFEDYLLAVEQVEERLNALNDRIEHFAEQAPWRERVQALRCFHGINTVTALALVAEIHDPRRFPHPRKLMSYLGLVPREMSSGQRERRGGITAGGNRHVRRLLVEAAWHYRHKPVVGRALRLRRREQDPKAIALADRALRRLTLRQRRMLYQGKHANLVNIAIARELVGFVWNVLQAGTVKD